MRNASLERWEKVTHISIGFAWVVAALFGIAGYATFRALSQGMEIYLPVRCPRSFPTTFKCVATHTHTYMYKQYKYAPHTPNFDGTQCINGFLLNTYEAV